MRRSFFLIFSIVMVGLIFSSMAWGRAKTIKIGINAPLTGDIPKVGEGTKFAARMWLEDIKAAGGLEVGGEKYPVELVIIGPQSSKQAVPAGEVAENYKTPMISPWSTNPDTTRDRPYVFRGCFLDPFQGPVLANFITEEFRFTKAAVLYDIASDYPKGLAEFFRGSWEKLHGKGSVVAFESFTTKDADFSSQLTKIVQSGAEVLFTPQYYNEVALIVQQAHQLGWNKPIVGSDSWGSAETVELCGRDCYGLFFSTHYAAAGATGATRAFIERYKKKHGYVPDDVAALTWDSLGIVQMAIQATGGLTWKIKQDRKNVRNVLAQIKQFEGITGRMTFTEDGDPIKCAVIVKISDRGEFQFYKSICP